MAITYEKLFQPFMLATTDSTLFTNNKAAGTILRGGRVRVTNVTNAARQYTIYCVPSAGSSSTTNAAPLTKSIAAFQYEDVDIPLMAVGDSLVAKADAATSVNIQAIAGAYFTP
ncbi:hypothetical protein K6V90_09370 [Cupriavidus pauculus]|uniref:hypothetical protein n=1 Tax=Cupriavidus pauculus TaxID=82633 RepID=UPI001C935F64|nr:hypothetical protein [Cupriavidus pauculus]MBY4730740.1 hypothetical protein [Cupriavidus pauculus]